MELGVTSPFWSLLPGPTAITKPLRTSSERATSKSSRDLDEDVISEGLEGARHALRGAWRAAPAASEWPVRAEQQRPGRREQAEEQGDAHSRSQPSE
ncbi:MAG: hypothetical protein SGPRY_014789 [Prymnesium sp.]